MTPAGLQNLLNELHTTSAKEIERRLAAAYEQATQPVGGRVVIFGAGQLGRMVLPGLRRAGIEPVAYCDNNPRTWGTEIGGVAVISPAEAMQRYHDQAFFLTAIYNASKVREQLLAGGCTRIVSYPLFYQRHGRHLEDERLDFAARILDQARDMEPGYQLLADDESRQEFLAQIRWRCELDSSVLPPHHPGEETPFGTGLIRLFDKEVYVDCGAFDGDSVRAYLARVGDCFGEIHAFEPDAGNLAKMADSLSSLAAATRDRIHIAPFALGRENGAVRFAAEGSAASHVTAGTGTVEVRRVSLDSYCAGGIRPTFIKMDIEGAEIEAIPGGAHTIAQCQPVMAVCAYHRPSDLWKIPVLLQDAWPGYRIFLRRYAEDCWETIYYAVPPDRLAVEV